MTLSTETTNQDTLKVLFEFYQFELVIVSIFALIIVGVLFMQNRNKKQLWKLAYIDPMTLLPNFRKFKLDAIELFNRFPEKKYVAILLDINKLNLINEMDGIEAGDSVIQVATSTLSDYINPKTDLLAKMQSDYFIMLIATGENDSLPCDISDYAGLREKVYNKTGYRVNFTIGRYAIQEGEKDINKIFEKVNYAHRIAKQSSALSHCYDYNDELKQHEVRERELENKMESALENKEFKVYLQPKYCLADESIIGAEALVRWVDDKGVTIYPSEFIPLFEKNGFIQKLDMYMFAESCKLLKDWQEKEIPLVTISVNFSRLHINNPNFVQELANIADKYDAPKNYLEIELTETAIISNEDILEEILNSLHTAGFTLSMDDFGSGYSSLGLLKDLPVDVVKIDRSFFTDNKHKDRARTVLYNIINLTRDLRIHTIAEGVESQEHIDYLKELGCENVQGFFYARPMPAEDFANLPNIRMKMIEKNLLNSSAPLPKHYLEDFAKARSGLGSLIPIELYRLFESSTREALKELFSDIQAREVMRVAGKIAGVTFTNQFLDTSLPFGEFVEQVKAKFIELKIGVINVEFLETNLDESINKIIMTVADDLDCSGLTKEDEGGIPKCNYDEGLIAGILYAYTNKSYSVIETDCWTTGAELCRFEVEAV